MTPRSRRGKDGSLASGGLRIAEPMKQEPCEAVSGDTSGPSTPQATSPALLWSIPSVGLPSFGASGSQLS